MSRIVKLVFAALFVSLGAALVAADEPCAKCSTACCADQRPTRACNQDPAVVAPSHVEVRMLIAEIDQGSIRGFCLEKGRGKARILAAPIFRTFSGTAARMTVAAEIPIIVPMEEKNVVEFRECGFCIDCVPTITDRDTILLQLRHEISSPDFANGVVIKGCTIPEITQRVIDTSVEVQPGESFVVAGHYETVVKPDRTVTCLANWCSLTAVSSCASNVLPPLCFANSCMMACTNSATCCAQESKELVILVAADLCDVANGKDADRIEVTVGVDEADSEEPHRPAILLTPMTPVPDCDACSARPHAKLFLSPANEQLFDACFSGKICQEATNRCRPCQQACCEEPEKCELRPNCCPSGRSACSDPDDDCEDDDEDGRDDGEIESFISQVLQAQMQYLDGMMRARLEHERQLLQTKAEAESAMLKQQVTHAEEILNIRSEHIAEIHEMKEAIWAAKLEALEMQHQQAIEHQRNVFALQQRHTEQLQSERLTSLQAEIRSLRNRVNSGEPERIAHTPDATHQSSMGRRAIPIEIPIQVEDLASGRVRYAPVPPKPDNVVLYQPRDFVERVEFSTPPISTTQTTMWQEMECLRREVVRLRVLVEDLLCFAPDFPPNPVPQLPMGECEKD